MLQIFDTRMGFPSPSLNVEFDYFSHSCLKMCKICLKRILDATFLDCLALTFCDVIGELLPEWACLTLQGGTKFLLTSKLADIPVSRVRKCDLTTGKFERSQSQVGESSVHSGRKTHSGWYLPMTSENIKAKQSRKVTSSDRFICNLHIFLGKNKKTPWGKDEETPSSCSRSEGS